MGVPGRKAAKSHPQILNSGKDKKDTLGKDFLNSSLMKRDEAGGGYKKNMRVENLNGCILLYIN